MSANIARHLPLMARAQPDVAALKVPRGRTPDGRIDYLTLTFGELETEVARWQALLRARGVQRGDRVLVMVRQGLPLIASVFALFATGAVPVVIDPGMGRKSFLACVARARPRGLLGIPLARVLSHVFRSAFRSVQVRVPAPSDATARLPSPGRRRPVPQLEIAETAPSELAAVLFTSGSTGAPKGVCYEHGMFAAQVELIRDAYSIQPGEVDLPMLPIFALFNPALGMTTVVPEIDPSRPAGVDPQKIVQAIQQEGVTNSFGSPTLWLKIARHCEQHQLTLPSLRRVLCAGAPVPPVLWNLMGQVMPQGELHSPYGATEALPVATVRAREIQAGLAQAALTGAGTCVGRPLSPNQIKIVALSDEPIATLAQARELPAGAIGEIIVRGPSVTREYDQLPEATQRAKIGDAGAATAPASSRPSYDSGSRHDASATTGVWHRMGDCGCLDGAGRLWFCGRAAERVVTPHGPLFTEQVEPFFNHQPGVRRSALIGLGERGQQEAALVVEPIESRLVDDRSARAELAEKLHAAAKAHPFAHQVNRYYFHRQLPVDVRHNAKIHRLTLAHWAKTTSPHWVAPEA
jgi:olefin beta-lactone synthetase